MSAANNKNMFALDKVNTQVSMAFDWWEFSGALQSCFLFTIIIIIIIMDLKYTCWLACSDNDDDDDDDDGGVGGVDEPMKQF